MISITGKKLQTFENPFYHFDKQVLIHVRISHKMHWDLFGWLVFKVYKMACIKIKINNVEMFFLEQLHMSAHSTPLPLWFWNCVVLLVLFEAVVESGAVVALFVTVLLLLLCGNDSWGPVHWFNINGNIVEKDCIEFHIRYWYSQRWSWSVYSLRFLYGRSEELCSDEFCVVSISNPFLVFVSLYKKK